MADPRLEFDIVADDKQARANLKKLETAGTNTTANIAKGFALAQIGIAAAGKAIQAVTGFVKGAVAASNEQIAAVTSLNAALEAQGNLTATASQDIQDFAAEMQSLTTIGDEVTISMAAQIEAMTGLGGDALPQATQAAIQLSKAFGIELTAAAKLVGKELISDTSLLNRYGIQVDKSASQQEQLNQILEATAAGMSIAQAEATTFEGRLMQLDNAYGDLLESIGAVITDNQTMMFGLGKLTEVVQLLITNVDEWFTNNKAVAEQIAGDMLNALVLLVQGIHAVVDGFTLLVIGGKATATSLELVSAAMKGDFFATIDLANELNNLESAFINTIIEGAQFNQELNDLRAEIAGFAFTANTETIPATQDLAGGLDDVSTAAGTSADKMNEATKALEGFNFQWMIFGDVADAIERGGDIVGAIPGTLPGAATTPSGSTITPSVTGGGRGLTGGSFAAAGVRPRGGLPLGGFSSSLLGGGGATALFNSPFQGSLFPNAQGSLQDPRGRGSSEANPLIVKVVGPSMNLSEAVV
jgi:hypothetical protein